MKKTHVHLLTFLLCAFLAYDATASLSGWTQKANFGAVGRHRATGIAIGTKGYMGLGHYNGAGPNIVKKDWWEFDPATNSWTQRADYIGNNGNGNYACIAFGMDEYGYVGGGQVGTDLNLYRYDPVNNQWTLMGPMPTQYLNREGFVINNKAYAMSGSTLSEYNPATNSWSTKNPMPFSVWSWNAAFTIDGKGYVKSNLSMWEYKPLIDEWVSRTSFPGLADAGGASFTQNNKGYFICGYDGGFSQVQSEFWEFDPATNAWTQLPDFPGSARRFCSAFTINNRSYFGIGTNGTNFNDFWEFNASQVYASVDQFENDIEFSFGPNPSSDWIRFTSEKLHDYSIEIFSLQGQQIAHVEATNGECLFSKNELPAGTYVFRVMETNQIRYTNRFILN